MASVSSFLYVKCVMGTDVYVCHGVHFCIGVMGTDVDLCRGVHLCIGKMGSMIMSFCHSSEKLSIINFVKISYYIALSIFWFPRGKLFLISHNSLSVLLCH